MTDPDPNDVTIVRGSVIDDYDEVIDLWWIFALGVFVGILLAGGATILAVIVGTCHPSWFR